MIQALIVEDEDNSREVLTTVINKYCPQVEIRGYAADANEAVEKIQSLRPNTVFMDIELPYGNAFDIISRLKEINFHIVLTTAYDEYVIKAIKAGATDYLLKPIDHMELIEAVRKIEKKIEEKEKYINLEAMIAAFSRQLNTNSMALPTMEGYNFIKFDEVIRIAADGNYCKIFCVNNKTYTITRQIHDIELKLPAATFCRVHNSHIISLMHIKEYIKGRGGYVTMADGSHVDVSIRRKDEFLERFAL
jgi:two-component system LytT family response regulator